MAVSALLELLQVAENQAAKATAANFAIGQLEAAVSDKINVNTSAATSPGDDVVVLFDDANDLSARTALRAILYILDAGATAAFDLIHPDNKHFFVVTNNTVHDATVKTLAGSGGVVAAGQSGLCYCDGTDVTVITLGSTTTPYDSLWAFSTTPTSSEVVETIPIVRDVTFPADFAGSVGTVETNPTGTFTLLVKDDGVQIGTIEISTGGVFTFLTTGNIPIAVAAGSILTVEAPVPVDATIANCVSTLLGNS